MANEKPIYMGPRLRRLRRELGLTQADMAADMDISASYVALLERNHRPFTADLLLRLARTYRIDLSDLADDGAEKQVEKLRSALAEPLFDDLELASLEIEDLAVSYPAIGEAFLRLHEAWREEQQLLADRSASGALSDSKDPIGEVRSFLGENRNYFAALDEKAERSSDEIGGVAGLSEHFRQRHGLRVRKMPPDIMMGSVRRHDRHREAILLLDTLDAASEAFQLALQWAYLELEEEIARIVERAGFATDAAPTLARRALASYSAAAFMMPYGRFFEQVEERAYDVVALGRVFGASFEQVAHRLTSLQRPGKEAVPFFFLRIDAAGNVSKRLDGTGESFARHGGQCPLWRIHDAFRRPREIVSQWIELPAGERYFSITRTVGQLAGHFGADGVDRAVILGCRAEDAEKLIYARAPSRLAIASRDDPTPTGLGCSLCYRTGCEARAVPPIGRHVFPVDHNHPIAPFDFGDR